MSTRPMLTPSFLLYPTKYLLPGGARDASSSSSSSYSNVTCPVTSPNWRQLIQFCTPFIMCLKVCVSVIAFYFVCLLTLTDGFFLPVFIRKQHPQTPTLNNGQWTSYQSSSSIPNPSTSLNSISNNQNQNPQIPSTSNYKDYNPFQQSQGIVTPLHQVHVSPIQTQYSYESGTPPYVGPGAYPQYHSAFHSVQLVPCLCPISKDVIEQQHTQSVPSNSPSSASEPVTNEVLIKGSQKVTS